MRKVILFALTSVVALSARADIDSGLVAYFPFDGSGTNSVGTGLDLTSYGVTYQPGLHGQAAAFDGSGQHLETAGNFPITGNMSRSVSVWLKPNTIAGYGNVLGWGIRDGGALNSCWDLELLPPNQGQAWINAAWKIFSSSTPFTFALSNWVHLAVTYEGSSDTATFYVNGTNVGGYYLMQGGLLNTLPAPLLVGYLEPSQPPGGSEWNTPWNGLMDDLRIYSRVLNPDEVLLLATMNLPPTIRTAPQSALGYWGGSVQFSVEAEGNPAPGFLWYKDGFPLPWATNSVLALSNLDFSDAGAYTVVAGNGFGSVTSAPPAYLVVNPAGVSIGLYPFVTISGTVGKSFGIQYSTNLSQPNSWVSVTNITLTQPNQVWIDTSVDASPGKGTSRFYRVVALPSP